MDVVQTSDVVFPMMTRIYHAGLMTSLMTKLTSMTTNTTGLAITIPRTRESC